MRMFTISSLTILPLALGSTIGRRGHDFQQIPDKVKAPNTFHKGKEFELKQPPHVDTPLPNMYRERDIDIPFGRVLWGKVMFFQEGEMNTPRGITDEDGKSGEADDAKQSACGIPDNAYRDSKVAIHPYWLKYAGLDRKPGSVQFELIFDAFRVLSANACHFGQRLLHARCLCRTPDRQR